jgi:hypothetical protein
VHQLVCIQRDIRTFIIVIIMLSFCLIGYPNLTLLANAGPNNSDAIFNVGFDALLTQHIVVRKIFFTQRFVFH